MSLSWWLTFLLTKDTRNESFLSWMILEVSLYCKFVFGHQYRFRSLPRWILKMSLSWWLTFLLTKDTRNESYLSRMILEVSLYCTFVSWHPCWFSLSFLIGRIFQLGSSDVALSSTLPSRRILKVSLSWWYMFSLMKNTQSESFLMVLVRVPRLVFH